MQGNSDLCPTTSSRAPSPSTCDSVSSVRHLRHMLSLRYLIFNISYDFIYIFTATRKNLFMTKEVSEVQQLDYPVTRKLETGETG